MAAMAVSPGLMRTVNLNEHRLGFRRGFRAAGRSRLNLGEVADTARMNRATPASRSSRHSMVESAQPIRGFSHASISGLVA